MSKEKRGGGIAVAGTIVTDLVKTIDTYPAVGMLANVRSVSRSVGGCVANTAADLAAIDPDLPVSAIGQVGDDANGLFVRSKLEQCGVDCSRVIVSPGLQTGFTDVMSLPGGERTFFFYPGTNRTFSPERIDLSTVSCEILHAGYILMLDAFDAADPEYGTGMARFLHDARARGFKTSVDMVSNSTADFAAALLPALPFCTYVIINEVESGRVSGLEPYRADGSLDVANIRRSMAFLAAHGVAEKVIVHCRLAGFCLDVPTGAFTAVPSLRVPPEAVKGSVGAGDAFCAGCLYALLHGYDDRRLLTFAHAAAVCSLFAENSIDGMRNKAEIERIAARYEPNPWPPETDG